jgi:ketosteroid isomerase-like protein
MTAAQALVAEELVGLSHELVQAVQAHDGERLAELLGDEFTLDGAAGRMSRDELLEAASGPYEIEDFAYDEIDPQVYGNTAVVVSRYRQRARLGTSDLSRDLRVTDVWVRRQGRWQIVRRHATPDE